MISDDDIHIIAEALIRLHNEEAQLVADMLTQELINQNDIRGASIWLGIGNVIENINGIKNKNLLN